MSSLLAHGITPAAAVPIGNDLGAMAGRIQAVYLVGCCNHISLARGCMCYSRIRGAGIKSGSRPNCPCCPSSAPNTAPTPTDRPAQRPHAAEQLSGNR